jgi:ribosome-associated translation inhibitor RaiA
MKMKMSLQFKDLQVAASDRKRIEERIRLALTRFAPLVQGVTATVTDENGTRGGIDKRCRLVVRLRAGTVVVNDQASAVMAAVTQAAERAARSVARIHHRAVDARQTAPGAGRRRRDARSAGDWLGHTDPAEAAVS